MPFQASSIWHHGFSPSFGPPPHCPTYVCVGEVGLLPLRLKKLARPMLFSSCCWTENENAFRDHLVFCDEVGPQNYRCT